MRHDDWFEDQALIRAKPNSDKTVINPSLKATGLYTSFRFPQGIGRAKVASYERIVKNAELRAVRAKALIWRVPDTPAFRLGFVMTTEMGFSPDGNGRKAWHSLKL